MAKKNMRAKHIFVVIFAVFIMSLAACGNSDTHERSSPGVQSDEKTVNDTGNNETGPPGIKQSADPKNTDIITFVSEKPGDSVTVDVKKDNISPGIYEITHLKGTGLVTVTGPAVKYMEVYGGIGEDMSGERIAVTDIGNTQIRIQDTAEDGQDPLLVEMKKVSDIEMYTDGAVASQIYGGMRVDIPATCTVEGEASTPERQENDIYIYENSTGNSCHMTILGKAYADWNMEDAEKFSEGFCLKDINGCPPQGSAIGTYDVLDNVGRSERRCIDADTYYVVAAKGTHENAFAFIPKEFVNNGEWRYILFSYEVDTDGDPVSEDSYAAAVNAIGHFTGLKDLNRLIKKQI